MDNKNFNGYSPYNSYEQGSGYMNGVSNAFGQARELFQQKVIANSFLYMFIALIISAISAKVASMTVLMWMLQSPMNMIILCVAELVVVLIANVALKANNAVLSAIMLAVYAAINGATIGIICMAYAEASVAQVFLITALTFGAMAFVGLVTKKDLSSLGAILFMALIGILIASVVNIFVQSNMLTFGISVLGVFVFVGLTAYDTQKIKKRCAYSNESNMTCFALAGALELYLDFINLFLYLLRLLGKRR